MDGSIDEWNNDTSENSSPDIIFGGSGVFMTAIDGISQQRGFDLETI